MRKYINIKKTSLAIASIIGVLLFLVMNGCAETEKVKNKSGALLWAENCQRCHNTPAPGTFSHEQWETLVMHMQTRALLTETEKKKITAFLKQ